MLGYNETLDIAILSTSAKNTVSATLGNSSAVQVGDTVYAIGYPEAFEVGFSSSTFTTGMVSMNRSIGGYTYIQSTVDITHGNSGGALINTYGEVIGITTAGLNVGNVDYMNLSIPVQRIDTVSRNVNETLDIVTRRHYPVYVTYQTDNTVYKRVAEKYESTATKPSNPIKTGYTFENWYTDKGCTKLFDFNTKILANTTLYAKFNINSYQVTYNLASGLWNGATPQSTYTINECTNALPIPTRSGYLFEGWTDSADEFIDNFPASSELKNLTLTANWIQGAEGLSFNGNTITKYTGTATEIVIPRTYRKMKITNIGDYAFSGCSGFTSIIIPDSVTSIGKNAFKNCSGLTSIIIPNSVTSIVEGAFSGCSIQEATIPAVACAAISNPVLKTVIITGGENIGSRVFSGCTSLTSITIGNSVTIIGDSAFSDCTALTSVTIPNSVTSIGGGAFSGCSSLKSITLPFVGDRIKTASDTYQYPFGYIFGTSSYTGGMSTDQYYYGNSTVNSTRTTYYIPATLKNVTVTGGNILCDAFENCSSLTSITLPNSVTSIEAVAFCGCTSLTSITIPNSVTSIGGSAFSGCSSLTSVTLPNSVTSIGWWAFYGCTSLTSIIIPKSVTTIEANVFHGCTSLTSIIIPKSVTTMENFVFSGCSKLQIYCEATSKPSGWSSEWNSDNRPVVWGYQG